MRTRLALRNKRSIHAASGAIMLVVPASAAALSSAGAAALAPGGAPGSITPNPLSAAITPRTLDYGDKVTVRGVAPATDAGQTLALELAARPGASWRALGASTVHRDGSFRFEVPLHRSGLMRVTIAGGGPGARVVSSTGAVGSSPPPASAPQAVSVGAKLKLTDGSSSVLGGQPLELEGKLLPAVAGRRVSLERGVHGSWRSLVTATTGSLGGFRLRYPASGTPALGGQQLRVSFAGDEGNGATSTGVGPVAVLHASVASWYDDGGNTACGFHAYFGVANRTLPCGARVSFRYGSRTVTAVVDDRGPFVGGRDWDLNQNTAAALSFNGVDTVWASM